MKNTPRYSSALVSGFPTAPMTSAAHPWMPSAPAGADDAKTTRRTRSGRIRAISWATKLPMENPSRSTALNCSAVRNAIASWAICSIVGGVIPVEPPTPALSNATTRRAAARSSTSAGSQLSRFPRKCWSRMSGSSPWPASRYA